MSRFGACSARISGDTHTHTDTQNDYRNPRCACASRVNNVLTLATIIHKWKNHFSEMKGDVGMSLHEKEGEQEDA